MQQTLDYIIHRLEEKQVPYNPPVTPQLDLEPYPIDFEYLGRSLHRFPAISKDFKIVNITNPTIQQAILFSIYGGNPNVKNIQALKINGKPIPLQQITPEQLCHFLNINLLILGPDEEHIRQYLHQEDASQTKNQTHNQTNNQPTRKFALVYHDYYNHCYPIISLEKQEVFLFDGNDSSIQELRQLSESPTPE